MNSLFAGNAKLCIVIKDLKNIADFVSVFVQKTYPKLFV
jgi:hypothetical protein